MAILDDGEACILLRITGGTYETGDAMAYVNDLRDKGLVSTANHGVIITPQGQEALRLHEFSQFVPPARPGDVS